MTSAISTLSRARSQALNPLDRTGIAIAYSVYIIMPPTPKTISQSTTCQGFSARQYVVEHQIPSSRYIAPNKQIPNENAAETPAIISQAIPTLHYHSHMVERPKSPYRDKYQKGAHHHSQNLSPGPKISSFSPLPIHPAISTPVPPSESIPLP